MTNITTKIDRRRNYIIMLDTETCNTLSDNGKLDMSNVLVYDCGFSVCDTRGNVYETHSYVVSDVFMNEKDLMNSAYYAEKIPNYWKDIWNNDRKVITYAQLKKIIRDIMIKYDTHIVCAHNARFDVNALNVTERYITKSEYRYFLPYGTEIWDSLMMARSVIGKMPTYKKYCIENGYMTKNNQCRFTAEILFRFISKDESFIESHTALEDVMIEKEIVKYCYRQHKAMKKVLFAGK